MPYGATIKIGAARRTHSSPAIARIASNTPVAVTPVPRIEIATTGHTPVRPIASRNFSTSTKPGGWPRTCTE